MKRHTAREWTVEEFDDWRAATDRHKAVAQAADEEGGPSLSLVPKRGAQRSSAPVANATRTADRRHATMVA